MLPNRLLLSATALLVLGLGGFIWTRTDEARPGISRRNLDSSNPRNQAYIAPENSHPGPGSVDIRGRAISDENGRPIYQALISLTRLDRSKSSKSVLSQRDGGFRAFTPPGRYAVTAFAPGYLPKVTAAVTTPTRTDTTLPLSLGGLLIRGSVVDDEGRPIEGAWVHAFDPSELKSIPLQLAGSKTDVRGRYRISVTAGPISLRADRDGFEPQLHTYNVTTSSTLPPMALEDSGLIEGRVSKAAANGADEPITVHWSAKQWVGTLDGGLTLAPSISGEVVADPNGAYVIPRLPGGARVALQAYGQEGASTTERWLQIGRGEARDSVSLSTSPRPAFRGNIVDSTTGTAIRYAEVSLGVGAASRRTLTPIDGSFILPRDDVAVTDFRVEMHGYAPHVTTLGRSSSLDLGLIALMPARIKRIQIGSNRSGVVSIFGETAVPGAKMRQLYFTDEDGSVDIFIDGVDPATIEALDSEGRRGAIRIVTPTDERPTAQIDVVPTTPFVGVLRDARGRPIADATVFVTALSDEDSRSSPRAPLKPATALLPRATFTDAAGAFLLLRSVPGTYQVLASDAHGFPIAAPALTIQVSDGNAAPSPQNLLTSYALREVSGTVTDTQNLPAPNASITLIPARVVPEADYVFALEPAGKPGLHIRADDTGNFSVQVPEGAHFSIVAESSDHLQGAFYAPLTDKLPIDVRLESYGHLYVELSPTYPTGACTHFELRSELATMEFALHGETLEIDRFVPGAYIATFTCDGATASQHVNVSPGQHLHLRQLASNH